MPISVMLKPSSSACNLKCEYCFYASLSEHRDEAFKGMMTAHTAENVIKSALSYANGTDVYFTFQGGEPLLSGMDFFENFLALVEQYNTKGSKITNCIQTNGTLINEQWCEFFSRNNILVGVSLDGDRELNSHRMYKDGTPSFDDVVQGIELLKKYKVSFNILSVLTSELAQNFKRSYRFFKSLDLHYLQYIPCLSEFGDSSSPFSMSCDDYAYYLTNGYKLYYNEIMRGVPLSVRQFDNYRLLLRGRPAEQCGMNGFCSEQFVVEGDGSVYPCDFYCTNDYYLGNINDTNFSQLKKSDIYTSFIKSSFVHDEKCKTCSYFSLCRGGGCKRNRVDFDYCAAYKKFFSEIISF